jgi:hypothetical protein
MKSASSKIGDLMGSKLAELVEIAELVGVEIQFGLRAQGHLPYIEAALSRGETWLEIGKAIGWDPKTAEVWYAKDTGSAALPQKIETAEDDDSDMPCGCCDIGTYDPTPFKNGRKYFKTGKEPIPECKTRPGTPCQGCVDYLRATQDS